MKLKVLEQIHISSVSPETLPPGATIAVSAALGKELLTGHPTKFEVVDDDATEQEEAVQQEAKSEKAPENKSAPAAPGNKAEPASPQNKAAKPAKPKDD